MNTDHKDTTSNSPLGWVATAAGGLGLLLALALMGQPQILVGVFDIAIPTILGVTAIVVALKVGRPHRWIGLATGGLAVLLAVFAVAVLLLDDTFEDDDVVEHGTSSSGTSEEKKEPASKQGTLVDSGFGQGDDEYVGLAAIVRNKSDHAGQTVTVSWNLKDADGKVLATESQVESFNWPGQELAVVTQADVKPGERVASVDATLLVEDDGTFSDSASSNLGSAEAPLVNDEYGGRVAQVNIKNPTKKVLKDPKVTAVCHDADDKIAGSGFTYADLIAASGEYAEDVDVIVSSGATSCKAYLTPGL